jgi:hypothetical protein
MKLGNSISSAGLVCSALLSSIPALAKPVTASDLTGKTICWSNGDKETYAPGGKFVSKSAGGGAWRLMTDGVVAIQGKTWDWTSSIEKNADGSFDRKSSGSGWSNTSSGRYCN